MADDQIDITNPINIVNLVNELAPEITAITSSDKSLFVKVREIIEVLVPKVETLAKFWKGSQKKQVVLQLLQEITDRYINVKWIPKFLINWVIQNVASKAIDKLVAYLNKVGVFNHRLA